MAERQHDIVLFGATGFTGGLTAEYLAAHADDGTRWALAGRNREKLEDVRGRLGDAASELPLIEADVERRRVDPSAGRVDQGRDHDRRAVHPLRRAARRRVRRRRDRLRRSHGRARVRRPDVAALPRPRRERTGARLVHSCGFDSIPYDLGALFTVEQLPEGVPIKLEGFVRAGGRLSGGTFHSAVHVMGRLRHGARVARERRAQGAAPHGPAGPRRRRQAPPRRRRRRVGRPVSDDRPADRAALGRRARPLRPRLHATATTSSSSGCRCSSGSASARAR